MKQGTIKINLERNLQAGLPRTAYRIIKITGAINCSDYRAGDYVSEEIAQSFVDDRRVEVTVVPSKS